MPLAKNSDVPPLINIGCGEDLTVRQLVELVAKVVDYRGSIVWDSGKPDGTMFKKLDIGKLSEFGWRSRLSLEEGLRLAYADYLKNVYTKESI
jgi:GDP-L-fucose synthase